MAKSIAYLERRPKQPIAILSRRPNKEIAFLPRRPKEIAFLRKHSKSPVRQKEIIYLLPRHLKQPDRSNEITYLPRREHACPETSSDEEYWSPFNDASMPPTNGNDLSNDYYLPDSILPELAPQGYGDYVEPIDVFAPQDRL